jgi:ABC-type transporter Mla subunit MlaD
MFDGLTDKKNKAQSELRQAIDEASQFRNDVSYLTKETEGLLNDLLAEQKLRKTAEQQLEQLKGDLQESQQ